jgi:D-alanyl-D-alanine carboxypeptidase (penicillin-binding protein 5/6)
MRRLAARLLIAVTALAVGGTAAGCSATPGLAYAQGATRPAASGALPAPSATSTTTVPESAQAKAPPVPGTLLVAGAPQGVKAREGTLVDEATGQVLWARGVNRVHPIASITKVMTALVILQAGGLNRTVVVPNGVKNYVAKYGAEAIGLIPGQVFTVNELMHAMLIASAADAAYTLANFYGPGLPAFEGKMNAEAKKLGLTQTHFTSPDGLPYPTENSTYSTAAQLVRLGEVAMGYSDFRAIVRLQTYSLPKNRGHKAYSFWTSNELIGRYGGVVGIKSGFTDGAGHTLLFEVVRGGRVLIGDVLGSPASGPKSAAKDATQVLNWGFSLKAAN